MWILTESWVYKVLHGGRNSTKSTSAVRGLVLRSYMETHRTLCCREIQESIKKSVFQLICDTIHQMGLSDAFQINDTEITGRAASNKGTSFIFEGLYRNVSRIKSLENYDTAFIEEADKVSDESWELLIPTIRTPNREFWIVFNDNSEDDPVYRRFILNTPPRTKRTKINYDDLPPGTLPQSIIDEAEYCKVTDPVSYERIWHGMPGGGGMRVWPAFDKGFHIKAFDMEEMKRRVHCFMAMDPHSKYFPACLWGAFWPLDKNCENLACWIYNEWPEKSTLGGMYYEQRHKMLFSEWGSMADLSREIKIRDREEAGFKVRKRVLDTRYAKGAGGDNWSTRTNGIVYEMSKPLNGGLHFAMPPERIIDIQRSRIDAAMRWDRQRPISEFNSMSLWVAPWCENTIDSLYLHRTVENGEREDEKRKDFSDALRILWAATVGYDFNTNYSPQVQHTDQYVGSGVTAGLGWMG